jgi:pyroglutamyl-peptidase
VTTVLITGFGPFGNTADNPSGRLAESLDGQSFDDLRFVGRVLPVATERVGQELRTALDAARPDVVLVTGLATGREQLALERVAVNVRDFPLPDVDGATPVDQPIEADGPAAYLASIPVKAVLAAWSAAGIAGYVSNTAGTYVCNQTFYLARHLTDAREIRCGLIHLPEHDPPPAEDLERAALVAARVSVTHRGADLRLAAGTVS